MKYLKLIIGVFIGLVAITIVAESIEWLIVNFASPSVEPEAYFQIRNQLWILILKIFYSLLAAIIGGYLAAWISDSMAKTAIIILIIIQCISILWAGFLSDLSSTGPQWMWLYLLVILPIGIWIGFRWRLAR